MLRKYKVGRLLSIFAFASLSFLLTASEDVYFYKVNSSLELFGTVFQEINENYVDELDPEYAIEAAIEGMMSILDPYTELLKGDELEELDIMTTGSYNGFGITVGQKDRFIEILNAFDDFPAQKAGIRIGDKLVSIDGVNLVDSSSAVLRKYSNGKPGSIAKIKILREGVKDTLLFDVRRADIKINDVSFYSMFSDNIGYIKIESFSKNTANEVINAIKNIKSSGSPNGLIIDLRGNGGGLLESAVSLSEIFLPKGSKIVSVKGRFKEMEQNYVSKIDPIEPTIPLIVLIDSSSASASEIFAGAIQDLDRGMVIGLNSFGKGLVQSVFSMPNQKALKITTAKYYTPSGRCIQKVDFEKRRNNHEKNTLFSLISPNSKNGKEFLTKNGRKVYETNGILPDSIVYAREFSQFVENIAANGYFYEFANKFTGPLNSLPENFKVNDKIINQFQDFLIEKKVNLESSLNNKINELEKELKSLSDNKKVKKALNEFKKQIQNNAKNEFLANKDDIEYLLNFEIKLRFNTLKKIQQEYLNEDNTIKISRNILKNSVYLKILNNNN